MTDDWASFDDFQGASKGTFEANFDDDPTPKDDSTKIVHEPSVKSTEFTFDDFNQVTSPEVPTKTDSPRQSEDLFSFDEPPVNNTKPDVHSNSTLSFDSTFSFDDFSVQQPTSNAEFLTDGQEAANITEDPFLSNPNSPRNTRSESPKTVAEEHPIIGLENPVTPNLSHESLLDNFLTPSTSGTSTPSVVNLESLPESRGSPSVPRTIAVQELLGSTNEDIVSQSSQSDIDSTNQSDIDSTQEAQTEFIFPSTTSSQVDDQEIIVDDDLKTITPSTPSPSLSFSSFTDFSENALSRKSSDMLESTTQTTFEVTFDEVEQPAALSDELKTEPTTEPLLTHSELDDVETVTEHIESPRDEAFPQQTEETSDLTIDFKADLVTVEHEPEVSNTTDEHWDTFSVPTKTDSTASIDSIKQDASPGILPNHINSEEISFDSNPKPSTEENEFDFVGANDGQFEASFDDFQAAPTIVDQPKLEDVEDIQHGEERSTSPQIGKDQSPTRTFSGQFDADFDDFEGPSTTNIEEPKSDAAQNVHQTDEDFGFDDFQAAEEPQKDTLQQENVKIEASTESNDDDFDFQGPSEGQFEADFSDIPDTKQPEPPKQPAPIPKKEEPATFFTTHNEDQIRSLCVTILASAFGSFSGDNAKTASLESLVQEEPSSQANITTTKCSQCGSYLDTRMSSCLLCGKPIVSTRNVIKKANIPLSSNIFAKSLGIIVLEEKKDDVTIEDVSILQPESFNFQQPVTSSPKSSPKVPKKSMETIPSPQLEPSQDGKPIALAANDLDYLQTAASSSKKSVKDFFVKTLEDIGISTSPKQERRKPSGPDPLAGWINQNSRKSQDFGLKPPGGTSYTASSVNISSIPTEAVSPQAPTPTQVASPPTSATKIPTTDPLAELIAKLPDLSFMLSPTLVTTK